MAGLGCCAGGMGEGASGPASYVTCSTNFHAGKWWLFAMEKSASNIAHEVAQRKIDYALQCIAFSSLCKSTRQMAQGENRNL